MADRHIEDVAGAVSTDREIDAAELANMLAQQRESVAEIDRHRAIEKAAAAAKNRTTPVSFVDCHIFGHAWEAVNTDRNIGLGWLMQCRCIRCGTERNDVIDQYGTVVKGGRRYNYADGYRDPDKWSRSEWRMQFLRRLNA
jgi:hypothetical protein